MNFNINDKFEVIEKEPYTGLTFGQHVVKPGYKFSLKDWPYSESMLQAAIKDERVKRIEEKKEEKKEKKDAVTTEPVDELEVENVDVINLSKGRKTRSKK